MKTIILLALILTSAACSTNLKPHLARVDGHNVEVVQAGSGPATVVFESGLGNDWSPWDDVASAVAQHARVFAYSRPGYGDSDSPTTPRDAKHIVEELRGLLAAQGYVPPYILVGHSFGGTYMELFAKSHPGEVAGLVLVDTRHRDFLATCEAAKFELCGIPADAVSSLPQVQQDEYVAFAMASPEIRAAGAFGSYPVRVLTATDHGNSAAKEALWESMLGALAAEAADGKQIVFPGSGHYIQLDRTSGVVDAIVAVLPAGVH